MFAAGINEIRNKLFDFLGLEKFRNKLLWGLVLVTVLPALLIGGYALIFTSQTIRNSSLSAESARVELHSEKIRNYFDQVNSDLLYLSDSNALNLYLSALESESALKRRLMLTNLRTSFIKFANHKKNYQQVRFINSQGMEVVRVIYDQQQAEIVSDAELQNKNDLSFFKRAMALQPGNVFLSALNLNLEGGVIEKSIKPSIRYATPVFNKENALMGIVVLNLDMKKINNDLTFQNQKDVQVLFVNPDGYYFHTDGYYFHTDENDFTTAKNNINTRINIFSERPELQNAVNQTSLATQHLLSQDDIITFKAININDNKFNIGLVLAIAEKDSVLALESQFRYFFISIILLVLLFTVILAIMLANSISLPLISLSEDVDKLSKGELETEIDDLSNDEIGKLANSVERLRKSMNILMKRTAT